MQSLRSVLRHVKRYKVPLSLTMLSMLALVGIQLIAPWLVRTMIATVTDPQAGAESLHVVASRAGTGGAIATIGTLSTETGSLYPHAG